MLALGFTFSPSSYNLISMRRREPIKIEQSRKRLNLPGSAVSSPVLTGDKQQRNS